MFSSLAEWLPLAAERSKTVVASATQAGTLTKIKCAEFTSGVFFFSQRGVRSYNSLIEISHAIDS